MFNIVLYQPEIPPNTGNIIRLAANTGATLHLVEPLGFNLEDRELRRAGLDYHEYASLVVHKDWQACCERLQGRRMFAFSTRGLRRHTEPEFMEGDVLVFGPETRGLPQSILDGIPAERRLRLPLRPDNRSLNLSNAVAVAVYEAWRQCGFAGSA
ncbi:MAG: tRNA (uridine(34)/cytosine(34)/5-carboxymethylaminomethyluridine(34)-2'-O)-methyltransferase TrmL [Proteobacteria bacterium]|nr:tRNA (uridine(34)/cytosine(34)/5-carboxymethylaminomethyluridine(34)-2'-O)-methyltransferase TrmL [Pseudomonadota bacterium]